MNSKVYIKNIVRKIIEYNQKIEYFRKITALNRNEIMDRQIKKERENLIAQLDMSNYIDKIADKKYLMKLPEFDFPLALKDMDSANDITIDCLRGVNSGNSI